VARSQDAKTARTGGQLQLAHVWPGHILTALQRHRLVKGCDADSSNKQDANKSNSAQDRTDPALGRPQSNDPNIKLENPRDMGAR